MVSYRSSRDRRVAVDDGRGLLRLMISGSWGSTDDLKMARWCCGEDWDGQGINYRVCFLGLYQVCKGVGSVEEVCGVVQVMRLPGRVMVWDLQKAFDGGSRKVEWGSMDCRRDRGCDYRVAELRDHFFLGGVWTVGGGFSGNRWEKELFGERDDAEWVVQRLMLGEARVGSWVSGQLCLMDSISSRSVSGGISGVLGAGRAVQQLVSQWREMLLVGSFFWVTECGSSNRLEL
ncbi:hypothetical protein NE237_015937 [Protea cynaroides]|uniref:Uncharacterized protein n=1 Tax=Protea cynaroides TaxID=273540 RepID=A0A9Q0KEY1_9MAGN|nr:hypothetical protein NE237_015937 [Protea cynaroides]